MHPSKSSDLPLKGSLSALQPKLTPSPQIYLIFVENSPSSITGLTISMTGDMGPIWIGGRVNVGRCGVRNSALASISPLAHRAAAVELLRLRPFLPLALPDDEGCPRTTYV